MKFDDAIEMLKACGFKVFRDYGRTPNLIVGYGRFAAVVPIKEMEGDMFTETFENVLWEMKKTADKMRIKEETK